MKKMLAKFIGINKELINMPVLIINVEAVGNDYKDISVRVYNIHKKFLCEIKYNNIISFFTDFDHLQIIE